MFAIAQYDSVSAFATARDTSTPTINISGKRLQEEETGFSTKQPFKLRIMPGCIVITVQDLRELWHCLEGLSR